MKDWLPLALFVVSGIVAAYAQRAYYASVARLNDRVRRDSDVVDDIQAHSARLLAIVAVETSHRLRSLLTRSQDARVERLRWLTLGSVFLTLALLIWYALSV